MANFDFKNAKVNEDGNVVIENKYNLVSNFASRVYLYAFIGLLISTIVCLGVSLLFSKFGETKFGMAYGIVLFMSAPAVFIISIIMMFKMRNIDQKAGVGIWVMYVLYTVCFGLMLSVFTLVLDFYTIGTALGITALCFGTMALIGHFSKKDMSVYGMIGMGILSGVILIGLFIPLFYFVNSTTFWYVNLIASVVCVLGIMFITLFDVSSIKKISESGLVDGSSNLAMLYALNIYTDIITLLMRVIYIILILLSKK